MSIKLSQFFLIQFCTFKVIYSIFYDLFLVKILFIY